MNNENIVSDFSTFILFNVPYITSHGFNFPGVVFNDDSHTVTKGSVLYDYCRFYGDPLPLHTSP